MCGIAGYCLNPKEHQRASVADLAGQMLLDIEHRGQHATGSAWINPANGNRVILKAAIPATKFVQYNKDLCKNAQTAILHTRWATQGDPKDNNNNHPIPRGKIVLTHNGHISNDRELFKQLKVARNGKVDSEAVLHCWDYLPSIQPNCCPLSKAQQRWHGLNKAHLICCTLHGLTHPHCGLVRPSVAHWFTVQP